MMNNDASRKTTELQMNYEFEKKETANKAEQEKKDAVAKAERNKQKLVLILVTCVLILVLIFAIFAYRSYLQKQKANIKINKQKKIIEEKQKEIIDSINYASLIQKALLPNEKYIEKNLTKFNKK
jgi:two-component system, NtrC family, sensor kinase